MDTLRLAPAHLLLLQLCKNKILIRYQQAKVRSKYLSRWAAHAIYVLVFPPLGGGQRFFGYL